MNSKVNEDAVLFMKPNTALCSLTRPLIIPQDAGECHNEVEVAVLIQAPLSKVSEDKVMDAVWGYGLGLDLTLRDVQKSLKQLGRPWERAKAFDLSAPVSGFVPADNINDISDIHFSLAVNDIVRQQGHTKLMMRSIPRLLSIISQHFTLLPGDIIFTGTPKGVGPLNNGDKLTLAFEQHHFETEVNNG
jgi:2-keto-4-pentenoate hydratase/2-oxohepta-3-ene-1,7-dioic acid hydratase in catechol pathway